MDSKQFIKLCNNMPSGSQIAEWIDALTRGDHTEASLFSGCLHYEPGSNKRGHTPHRAVFGSAGALQYLDSQGTRRLLGLWSTLHREWVVTREVHGYVALGLMTLLGRSGNSDVLGNLSYELSQRTQPLDGGEATALAISEIVLLGKSKFPGSTYKGLVAKHMALEVLDPLYASSTGHWLDKLYPGRDKTKAALSLMRDCTTPEVWSHIVQLYDESGGLPPGTLCDALNLMDRFRSE
jgi:hypothetical protein